VKVVWTRTAIARLEAIEDHIAVDDPLAAERFVARLLDAGDAIGASPGRGRRLPELPESGLREVVFHGYRIVYRAHKHQVQILTVFEGHRLLREHELDD
jgi:plasmid stabilization system protein ParE